MNTRQYPRDHRLAFRLHTDYACSIERPQRVSLASKVIWGTVIIVLGCIVLARVVAGGTM